MTKKHFIAIAATIRVQMDALTYEILNNSHIDRHPSGAKFQTLTETIERLCNVFADENPRFDRVRFLAACGINR